VDANKRTAMALGLALSEANGQLIQAIGDQEVEDMAVGITTHVFDVPDITKWFKSHYDFRNC
jgi:prophage maintenance system killer protein